MHLLHLVQVADDLFFRPVHNQHTPLLLVELVAAVAMAVSVVSVRAATVVCNSATMAAAAAVRGGCFLRTTSEVTMDFPSSSKNNLRLYVLCWFQEGSTAVNSTKALKAETSMQLKKRTRGHRGVRLLQM